jgi:RNA polymerase sigma-70 factor (ECF subfamily)
MELIYQQHAQTVYKYMLSLTQNTDTAEELTQETFYRAVYSKDNYDGSCKLSVWLCQIAKHIWYQELEKRKRKPTVEIEETMLSPADSPEDEYVSAESKISLYRLLHNLEEPTREVMYLRLSGELSYNEIGEILGKTETWARVTFYRGKQQLLKGGAI